MKLFDLRGVSNKGFKIYDISDDTIIYGQEISDFDGIKIGVFSFDNTNRKNTLLYKHDIIPGSIYENHIKVFKDKLLHINTETRGKAEIRIVDRLGADDVVEKEIFYSGDLYRSPLFVDENYFILFTETSEKQSYEYDRYKDQIDYYKFAYLIDIRDLSKHFIMDLRIVNGIRDHFVVFDHSGNEMILIEEAYMEEWEREDIYSRALTKNVMASTSIESIMLVSKEEFIKSIKKQTRDIEAIEIEERTLDGWCRYMGREDGKIYYSIKDFESKLESIYNYSLDDNKSTLVTIINHRDYQGRLIHSSEDRYIIHMVDEGDFIKLKGVFNSDIDIEYKKTLGSFVGVADKHLITWYSTGDEEEYSEKVVITDIAGMTSKTYDGHFKYFNENIILF